MIPAGWREIKEADPYLITVPATKQSLFPNYVEFWVTGYLIRVRSMGTATYIALGSISAQENRLTSVGQMIAFSCNPKDLLNLCKKWIVSDAADAIIEVVVSEYTGE